jgi:integrase
MSSKHGIELRADARSASEPTIGRTARRGALHRFTDADVRKLPDGMHSDGGGLILHVEGASRRWRFRYSRSDADKVSKDGTKGGTATYYVTIGGYPDRKLAEARAKAQEYRNMLADGIDPKAERERRTAAEREAERAKALQAEREANTLESVARAYHAAHSHEWTPKHGAQWLTSLVNHVFPKLGARPIAEIKPAELLDVLQPLRAAMPETGTRLRERLDAIFADALVRELCEQNPAAAIRKPLRGKRVRGHHAAMHWRDVPAFIRTVRASDRLGVSVVLAFEFLVLTAARTSEVLGATWGEIDTKARTWTIGGARMKAGQPHTVHLTDRALAILREAHTLRAVDPVTGKHKPADVVFPSPQRATRPLSNMAFLTALERLGLRGPEVPEADRTTTHGFRASFSTWANEHGFPRDVIEAALAHSEPNAVRAAYNRAEYVEQRKRLAEAWAAHCESKRAAKRKARGAS